MLDQATVIVRRSQPLSAEVDAETVMFDPQRGSYYALDPVGSRVWALLEQPISLGELYETLRAEFAVDAATCRRDVDDFIEQLRGADLLEVRA